MAILPLMNCACIVCIVIVLGVWHTPRKLSVWLQCFRFRSITGNAWRGVEYGKSALWSLSYWTVTDFMVSPFQVEKGKLMVPYRSSFNLEKQIHYSPTEQAWISPGLHGARVFLPESSHTQCIATSQSYFWDLPQLKEKWSGLQNLGGKQNTSYFSAGLEKWQEK